jgi:hypothetical protein
LVDPGLEWGWEWQEQGRRLELEEGEGRSSCSEMKRSGTSGEKGEKERGEKVDFQPLTLLFIDNGR